MNTTGPAADTISERWLIRMKIVAVRKDQDGIITDFKFDNNQEVDYNQAVSMARGGEIEHVDVFDRKGRATIRSQADGDPNNNLDRLPTF